MLSGTLATPSIGLSSQMYSFDPICSLPPAHTAYVNNPNVHNTSSIVFSSFTNLVLCTWSIPHLNVPIEAITSRSGFVTSVTKILYLFWTKVKWMVFALPAPELLLGTAVSDLLSARTSEEDMRDFAAGDEIDWTLANMGGFVVRFDDRSTYNVQDPERGGRTGKHNQQAKPLSGVEALSRSPPSKNEEDDVDTVTLQGNGKSGSFAPPCLETDTEILEDDSKEKCNIPQDAMEKTFCSFELLWDRKSFRRKFDTWLSLSAISRQNMNQPWKIGPAMDWKPYLDNQALILQSLSRLKCTYLESMFTWYLNLAALQGNIWVLDARQLCYAWKCSIITLPDINENELYDKSQSDILIKLIALGQMIWLAIELIARHIRGHAITQLEIMTLAFAACSSVTYLLLRKKPKDVKYPTTLHARRLPTPTELLTLANFGPLVYASLFGRWTTGRTNFWTC